MKVSIMRMWFLSLSIALVAFAQPYLIPWRATEPVYLFAGRIAVPALLWLFVVVIDLRMHGIRAVWSLASAPLAFVHLLALSSYLWATFLGLSTIVWRRRAAVGCRHGAVDDVSVWP